MSFNKFDESTIGILDVGKMSGCFAHIKAVSFMALLAVNRKVVSLLFAVRFQLIHAPYIKTEMYKSGITPEAIFINLIPGFVCRTNKFHLALTKNPAERTCERFTSFKQH